MLRLRLAIGLVTIAPGLLGQTGGWDAKSAAKYLDSRMEWWSTWKSAARDHNTFCVSCHTTLSYAAARASLRSALGEKGPAPIEQKLVDNVTARVRIWDQLAPYYPNKSESDSKTPESRGTEAILNAFVLARYNKGEDARHALDQMWAQQIASGEAKGAFPWLEFHNQPWEGNSQYYGAALAAIADNGEHHAGLDELKQYLRKDMGSRTLHDRVMLLWAATKTDGLLNDSERYGIMDALLSKQQPDGGFSLTSLVGEWKRHDNTPLETKSDGYATGLVAYVLEQAGVPAGNAHLEASLRWLAKNQDADEGRWLAYSLNKRRDLSSDIGKFMSDAATAYAVLALTYTR